MITWTGNKTGDENYSRTIFIATPWFYPAYKAGGPVQSIINLVEQFNEGVNFKIFCGDSDLNNEPLLNIETGKWIDYNGYTKVWYATRQNSGKTLLKEIKNAHTSVLFIIGIYDWEFNILPLIFSAVQKKIISVRGMLHPGALSIKPYKKKIFLKALKVLGFHKKVIFHVSDNAEETHTKSIFGAGIKTMIAGNFSRQFSVGLPIKKIAGRLSLVSFAVISPMKNYLLTLRALMGCTHQIEYNICGEIKDTAYWKSCKNQIRLLPENVSVKYLGVVLPNDVPNILFRHHVFIMPSKSENFGHAIIEALSAGIPVITTHNTPWNDLRKQNAGINSNEKAEDILTAINFFAAMSEGDYTVWSVSAKHFARERVNGTELKEAYNNLFT